jgi:biotin transport system substrate-specific component
VSTVAEALWPRAGVPARDLLRDAVLIVGFVVLIALLGRLRFYLPDNPVPVTMQTFGVLLAGASLGSWRGGASLLLFYFVGMAGLPVYQGGNHGWEYVTAGPTGGYLIGFIAASWLTGALAERHWGRAGLLWALLAGNVLLYVPGLLWLGAYGFVPWDSVLSKGLYPFVIGDLLKALMVGIVVPSAWGLVNLIDRRSDRWT